ncbi:MAG TPA: tetratricopeptide repeat protein [Armatimonadetes bacterium]|nr:tetratricopeptide repeat protein [Armatimonadota bacterium]
MYQLLLEHFPQSNIAPAGLFALGAVHYAQEKFKDAADAYGQLIQRFPNDKLVAEAHYWRANALWALKRMEEAYNEFTAFLKSNPQDADKRCMALYRSGLYLYESKRYDEAEKVFSKLATQHSESELADDALYQLGWVYLDAQRIDDALKAFQRLIQKHPQSEYIAEANFLIGEALFMQKKFMDALPFYERAAQLATGRDEELTGKAQYKRAWTLLRLKKLTEALAAFQQVIDKPVEAEIKADALLQIGYLQFQQGKYADALSAFERILKEYPPSDLTKYALLYRGRCLNELKRYDEAEKVLKEFLAKYRNDALLPQAQFELGWAYQNRRQWDAAMELYRKVTEADAGETGVEAQFRIGECLYNKGEFKAALREFLRVALLYEGFPQWIAASQFYAGMCYEQLREMERAKRAYRTVIEKYPQSTWAQKSRERLNEIER